MSAVQERIDATPVEFRDQLRDRQDERSRTGDVRHDDKPGACCHSAQDRVQCLARVCDGEGECRYDDPCVIPRRHRPHRVDRRVVLVVIRQQFVAGSEAERLEDRIDAGRRVRDEGQAIRVGAEETGNGHPRSVESVRQLATEESDRFGLKLVAEGSLGGEHRLRARPI